MDLAKASDTIHHTKLFESLQDISMRSVLLNLFKNYLDNKTQRTRIRNIIKKEEVIEYGVTQGTDLGPNFLLHTHINDIFRLQAQGTIISYGDNTSILLN